MATLTPDANEMLMQAMGRVEGAGVKLLYSGLQVAAAAAVSAEFETFRPD